MKFALSVLAVLSAYPALTFGAYNLARNYSGQDFFSGWTYYGNFDNLTNGKPYSKPSGFSPFTQRRF